MRHRVKHKKFGRHTVHILKSLTKSLVKSETMITTLAKAKSIRPIVEKLVTKGKKPSLHIKRYLMAELNGNKECVTKIEQLGQRYVDRPGGYLRIVKAGFRKGDAAPLAIIQFV